MFIRVKTSPNSPNKSVQIVESVRKGNRVSQRIVRHVGTALDDQELAKLKELAAFYKSRMEADIQPSLFSPEVMTARLLEVRSKGEQAQAEANARLKDLREEQRVVLGIHEAYGAVYKQLGFDRLLGAAHKSASGSTALYNIVMARIAHPASKRASVSMLEKNFGIQLNLNKVYRMMDKMDDKLIDQIQQHAYASASGLLKEKLTVIFYDCTTLYFESIVTDELKQTGYSKDGKFNQSQVMLALLVTAAGLPVGYEIYPGNTFEGHTFKDALGKVQQQYALEKVILVADSAMISRDNQQLLDDGGIPYIIAARLKNQSKEVEQLILNPLSYSPCGKDQADKLLQTRDGNNHRLIVHYSPKRAEKDRHDRQKAIDQVLKRVKRSGNNPKALLNNFGYKKYITIEGKTTITVDEQKIKQAQRWDGLHGVITNIAQKDMPAEEVLSHYHGLWQIEETFRLTKHDLKVRPIFHWTPQRIKAHMAICFMALTCIRWMEYQVATRYTKLSPEVIRQSLVAIQASILKHTSKNRRYCLPSQANEHARKIYKLLGLKLSVKPFEII